MKGKVEKVKAVAWVGRGGSPSGLEKASVKDDIVVVTRGLAKYAREFCKQHSAMRVGILTDGGVYYRDRKGNKCDADPILKYRLGK